MLLVLNMVQLILILKLHCSRIEIQSKILNQNHSKLNLEGIRIIILQMATTLIWKTLKMYQINHIKVKIENLQLLNQDPYHEMIKNKEFQILLQTFRNVEFWQQTLHQLLSLTQLQTFSVNKCSTTTTKTNKLSIFLKNMTKE
jgi:hypothetical protein